MPYQVQKVKQSQKSLITTRLNNAGIKVRFGKREPRKGEYSGIIGKSKKVLEIKI
jgi:hypothetical protein